MIKIRFAVKDCHHCPRQPDCTRSRSAYPRRLLTIKPREHQEALQAARRQEHTQEFARQYALRSGIEATISQGVRAFDLRRSRYVGLAKTHLQHLGMAAAINLVRVVAWMDGEEPAPTQLSAFQKLYHLV